MNDIYINVVEMELVITKLEDEINKLSDIYKEIGTKTVALDGTSDIWGGNTEKKAYEKYLKISSKFENTVNQMSAIKMFLENTLDNYLNSDKTIDKNINDNEEELNINK